MYRFCVLSFGDLPRTSCSPFSDFLVSSTSAKKTTAGMSARPQDSLQILSADSSMQRAYRLGLSSDPCGSPLSIANYRFPESPIVDIQDCTNGSSSIPQADGERTLLISSIRKPLGTVL